MTAHVLVVEDDPLVTGALRILFEATGHRFSEAGTVADALRVCTDDCPDVMLLDLTLPDGSGLDVLTSLRARGLTAPITAVLSGHDDPELAKRCRTLGCREMLLKPVTPRVLLAKINEWREQARST